MNSCNLNKFCVINSPEQAKEVSLYLANLMRKEAVPDTVLGREATRIHTNRFNHLCEKIKMYEEALAEEPNAIARTSSFVCYEKTRQKKIVSGKTKTYITETFFVWKDVVDVAELEMFKAYKAEYALTFS